MQAQKRSWLYDGISHPASIVLARPRVKRAAAVRRRLPPGSKLLIAGDDHAWGLSPFLAQLCRDTGVDYEAELDQDGSIETWAATHRLVVPLKKRRPDMVIVSLGLTKGLHEGVARCLEAISGDVRTAGATLVWVRKPRTDRALAGDDLRLLLDAAKIPSFHSEALDLPRGADGAPSVRGYAGWAGAIWRWIG